MISRQASNMDKVRVIIVTGVSGSGKTTAIRALEDAGYLCIDNLPIQLLDTVLLLCDQNEEVAQVAVVVDVRERHFASSYIEAVDHVRRGGRSVDVLYLDTADSELVRRFSATRRSHPLAVGRTFQEALDAERTFLADLREQATLVVDTSGLTVHDLKRRIQTFARSEEESGSRMRLAVHSFGYKYGIPPEAHYVFDVRFIPNPYFEEALRPLTGRDGPVRAFIEEKVETAETLELIESLLDFVVPLNEREGKSLLTLAVGCTGGKHRSVFFADRLGEALRAKEYHVSVFHRDLGRE